MRRFLLCLALLAAPPLRACDTALLLTIDVSNSIDVAEYRLQVDGLADALADPEVIDAMVDGQTALAVVQWSGADRQEMSIPWIRMTSAGDIAAFAASARVMPRAFVQSDTAPAEAIYFSLDQFAAVSDCARRVIDISGDGPRNAGTEVAAARRAAERAGVTINAIAIEGMGLAITGFYARRVITGDGFVITARTYDDYPRAIREKILREVARVFG